MTHVKLQGKICMMLTQHVICNLISSFAYKDVVRAIHY